MSNKFILCVGFSDGSYRIAECEDLGDGISSTLNPFSIFNEYSDSTIFLNLGLVRKYCLDVYGLELSFQVYIDFSWTGLVDYVVEHGDHSVVQLAKARRMQRLMT